MGTNYYWHAQPCCPTCGKPQDEPRHIGKSSAGWVFSLHVYPEEGIEDLDDWKRRFMIPGSCIKDEYGIKISVYDMLETITDRKWKRSKTFPGWGYSSEEEFYRQNYAEPGPNGLVRSKLDYRCIKHGSGTWDCFVNDFS